jgi:hypothetical protein
MADAMSEQTNGPITLERLERALILITSALLLIGDPTRASTGWDAIYKLFGVGGNGWGHQYRF